MAHTPRTYRFGPFELDEASGLLRKHGTRLRLSEQPLQILLLLIERGGSPVSREEIQAHLWPSDTFVDFDHSLNVAINKLRQVLGDPPEQPQFIETLPRRGYRFIARVQNGEQHLEDFTAAPVPILEPVADDSSSTASEKQVPFPPSVHFRRNRIWIAASLAGALAILFALWIIRLPRSSEEIPRFKQITNDGRAKWQELGPRLFTNGPIIFFIEYNGYPALAQVSSSGGETVLQRSNLPNPQLLDINREGSQLLALSRTRTDPDSPLWVLSTVGGGSRRLGELRVSDAAWSPDQKRLAYTVGSDLFLANRDGTDSHKLVNASGLPGALRWSPDGSHLGFTMPDEHAQTTALWEISTDGTALHQLLPMGWSGDSRECCGIWMPDGRHFVFQSLRNGQWNIWALRTNSHWFEKRPRPFRLTNGPVNFYAPAPSLDGKQIYVVGQTDRNVMMRFDALSGRFVTHLPDLPATSLVYSPQGDEIAFISADGILWRSKSDGSDRQQLTPSGIETSCPAWAPDGKRIAFVNHIPGKPWKTIILNSDGSGSEELLSEQIHESDPTWSPDGSKLAFGRPHGGVEMDLSKPVAIYVVDLKTRSKSVLPNSQGLFHPEWSPDGRYIAALSLESGDVMLFDQNSQSWSKIAPGPAAFPRWSRDNLYLYWHTYGPNSLVNRLRMQDHRIEIVTNINVSQTDNSFISWQGLAPDNSPLLSKTTSIEEIYALEVNWH